MNRQFSILLHIGFSFLTLAEANMSCLVMRPGYGLVTEECPSHAVGCRIRAKKDHIEWYELSRLYDRNQLVCVYPEEYKSHTGCMRKPTGSIRCWCGGRENCNDPETSRDLYEAFTEVDNDAVQRISEWLKSPDDQSSWKKFTTTETSPISTTAATISTKRVTPMKKQKITKTTTTPVPTTISPKKAYSTTKKMSPPITTTTTTTERSTTTVTTSTQKPVPVATKKPKRIGTSHKKTTVDEQGATVLQPKVINVVDIRDKGVLLPNDDDITLDHSFEETRKKLEKEMREEDERLREMLADEEEENSNDIDENENDEDLTAEDQREMERDRYRMERRRAEENRLQEDVILRRIEEEEIRASEKEEKDSIESYARIFDDDPGSSSSTTVSVFLTIAVVLIF